MVCKNCGSEILDGQKFCQKCGTPVENNAPVNTPPVAAPVVPPAQPVIPAAEPINAAPVAKKEFKMPKINLPKPAIIGIAVAVVVAILLAIILPLAGVGKPRIDMKNYVTVEFEGANKYAKYDMDIDYDLLEDAVTPKQMSKLKKSLRKNKNPEFKLFAGMIDDWTDLIDFERVSEKKENFENGDELQFDVVIDDDLGDYGFDLKDLQKALGVKFKNTSLKFNVEGLEDAKAINIFDDITACLKYVNDRNYKLPAVSGSASPRISIPDDYQRQDGDVYIGSTGYNDFSIIKDHKEIGKVHYTCSVSEGLSEGDKFTISANVNFYNDTNEYVVAETEREYTVPKLAHYVKEKSELTPELVTQLQALLKDYAKEKGYSIFDVKATKFGKIKPTATSDYLSCVFMAAYVGEYSGWFDSGEDYRVFTAVPLIDADGKLLITNNGHSSRYNTLEDATTTGFESSYYDLEDM